MKTVSYLILVITLIIASCKDNSGKKYDDPAATTVKDNLKVNKPKDTLQIVNIKDDTVVVDSAILNDK